MRLLEKFLVVNTTILSIWISMLADVNDLLDERYIEGYKSLQCCQLCPRNCKVNRLKGERGYCGLGSEPILFREMVSNYEESFLCPSYQLYFAGCNLRCDYCSVKEWNEKLDTIEKITPKRVIKRVGSLKSSGIKNINLLGGEPSVSIVGILDILRKVNDDIEIVWNSNMYYSVFCRELLDGVVDLYLADFKCFSANCVSRILGAEDYLEIVKGNLLRVRDRAELLIRHLILPGHFECCTKPILEWIAENTGEAMVSLRADYVGQVDSDVLGLKNAENCHVERAFEYADKLGLRLVR